MIYQSPSAVSRSPLVLILLFVNLIALGGLGYLQFKLFKQLEKQETVEDLINADKDTEKNPLEVALKKMMVYLFLFRLLPRTLLRAMDLDDLLEWMRS